MSTEDRSEETQFVLLKDGTLLPCTANQKQQIMMSILMTTHLDTQKVKLNGRIFLLNDMESDPAKIANARQQGLPLDVETAKKKDQKI